MPEHANDSEWVSPYFSQPKAKNNWLNFLSDLQNLNRQFKYKPYPLPKIRGILLKLKGFKYAISLDLDMGSYNTRLIK